MSSTGNTPTTHDAIIVGGAGLALQHAGVDNFVLIGRHQLGASLAWRPAGPPFITPSFPLNSADMLGLPSSARPSRRDAGGAPQAGHVPR